VVKGKSYKTFLLCNLYLGGICSALSKKSEQQKSQNRTILNIKQCKTLLDLAPSTLPNLRLKGKSHESFLLCNLHWQKLLVATQKIRTTKSQKAKPQT
jgi:hypothetical protein